MVEHNGPPSRKKREQFVPVAASGDSRDQGCDLRGWDRARTHTHKAVMMRPFPLSSPDPHLAANEKHDNYPQLFSPRPSASGNRGADMKSACRFCLHCPFLSPVRPLRDTAVQWGRSATVTTAAGM